MLDFLKKLLILIVPFLFTISCSKRPVINEQAFILIPHSEEIKLGDEATKEILKREKLVQDPKIVKRVEKVFERLLQAIPEEYRINYKWRVYVIDKKVVNAFALPNGNIFVYKGLVDFVKDDNELAAVLGHEMAHVILRHGAEKVSQAMVAQIVGSVLLQNVSPSYRGLAKELYAVGVNVAFLLPYSRKQEKEADIVGLLIMMRAGYNPEGAIKLWKKMVEKFSSKEPPEWLSDHPASKRRLNYIKRVIKFLKEHPEYVKEFKIPPQLVEEN